ncbi:MAG: 5-formyltetrahydrofolate cyclo-ligase [Butyricicoccus pullicaecorum]|nr:5-formyltetrahydrofolate cyclo-ligase [Butyricicoccus pullicaecorum]
MKLPLLFVMSSKAALRSLILEQRAQEHLEERSARAHAIAQSLFALPVYQKAGTIFCYCSTELELRTDEILTAVLKAGKTLCVPRCEGAGQMTARRIDTLDALRAGRFGIREPADTAPVILPEAIDLCIIPCLSADTKGYRLGYGGGYYDRFLAHTQMCKIVLCAARYLQSQPLPREKTDIPCHYILTERQVHRVR